MSKRKTASELARQMHKSAQDFNKRAQAAGLIVKQGTGWKLTETGKRYGEYREAYTRQTYGPVPSIIIWDQAVLNILY